MANLRIMHTAAHPADTFDMVGGTLAHHIERGDQVTVVSFTHGVRSHDLAAIEARRHQRAAASIALDSAVDEKEKEVVEACGILGITDVRFLRLEDDLLLVKDEYVRAMARLVREIRPDAVISHSPFEMGGLHTAHRSCCEITLLACAMAGGLMPGEPTAPHRTAEIFYVWQHGETSSLDYAVPRFPAILIDVTDVIEKKVRAMDRLRSQYYPGGLARKCMEDMNASHGVHMCVPYCEAFMRHYPEVHRHLPVCEHNLRIAREPLAEIYARLGRMIVPKVPFEPSEQ